MFCQLCGKHLYQTITFQTLFKINYKMHIECEQQFNMHKEFDVFPLGDQMVYYNSLFDVGYEESDKDYLFVKYMGYLFEKVFRIQYWSIIILLDDITDSNDFPLVLSLGSGTVIMLSMFGEEIYHPTDCTNK